ncbi:MAG: response regulator transcription factor [Planctomycetota bacterium]|jgi:DNA-binding NarL/FixJ family response regulator
MPGHVPSLDPEALRRLRRLVKQMDRRNGDGVPMGDLVELARDVRLEAGLTIDFEASRELGQPMVVVRLPAPPSQAACLDVLTPREQEVARLVADGLGNKQIAGRLFISLATVKDHVHNILRKTGLPGRAAVAAAIAGHTPASSSPENDRHD